MIANMTNRRPWAIVGGLVAIVALAASGLLFSSTSSSQVQASHSDFDTAEAACLHGLAGHTNGDVITVGGVTYSLVRGLGNLNGMDVRGTGRRDIIVSTEPPESPGVELSGRKGDDILCGGPGPDTLNGGSGNDYILGGPCTVPRCVDDPDDQLNGGSGDDNLFGEDGNDMLNGGGNDDMLDGGSGNDALWGGVGTSPAALWPWLSPFMRGGSGDDVLKGGEGEDELYGGSGDDVLIDGVSIVVNDDDIDALHGGNHNDDLWGGPGDTFDGGWHKDYCDDGSGPLTDNDTCEKTTPNQ